ncbi:hypothetical protein NL108_012672 [Boleophthalmus pectinirostris]|uniref:Golgi membrane protein 1 n=1 Tax=Boleophthalmus pectinirostris TaxID=150288 RepID=UPI00242FE73A|nr:Golgi membrane protein 1 [Boleophthalmus pectinirostris]KAJ0067957.1 hypothetical protein NL108_012672 [Boleophthalmus pectinirostris]
MGGLGNGRRGGRSPPLLIAALIACILVLGFNYWVSSSRNLELQTKLYELEGQVRRGAAERGVVEMKKTEFQEEIQRQKEQISHIENLYKKQLEGAQSTCSREKVVLQQNISSSTKTIQELKGQLNQLNDNVGQLQKELESCRGTIQTLNNKLTYDMTHCNAQVLSQKELCDERVAAAKLEAQKKIEKLIASSQANNVDAVKVSNETTKMSPVEHTPSPSQPKDQPKDQPSELLSNNILETNEVAAGNSSDQGLSKQDPLAVPTSLAVKQDLLPPPGGAENIKQLNTTDDKDMELMDTKDESHTEDPGMEDLMLSEGKAEEDVAQKVDLQDEYDTEDQEVVPEKPKADKRENLDQEEEDLADYNGDDENEGEFEADKQAALAQM